MTDTPELDQVAEARRKLAAQAGFPVAYWVFFTAASVLIAGLPIWTSLLPGSGLYFQWALLGAVLISAAYAVIRRRRSGVYLPRRVTSYPGARLLWITTLAATGAGYLGISALVDRGLPGLALAVLVPVAAVMLVGQVLIRSAMRRSIEDGRVTP
ncbi:hypothetical protein [Streptomonospora wellingtoniae]|uniref:Uncharacterized protein n=1 Tax=Streptomonospora wellingtoniae TaxID=3075544 RepID=A0ABU2KMY6_9ACTN|nr:hypothetical protein [Streptomonospora sp. DSM 45055]MDT0300631.1 hypothetical protein [Streptomonospora sp. DSM 45055]